MKDTPSELVFEIAESYPISEEELFAVIAKSENSVETEVERTAEAILSAGEKLKIVLLCGRSASGKTTFTKKLCKKLSEKGKEAKHIALDDFFLGIEALPRNEDGSYDMESIKGLDVALANECFKKLLTEGKADFPTFDFPKQRRGDLWNRVEVDEKSIIIIEGIHVLNPLLTEGISEEGIMRVFVEPVCKYCKDEKTVLTSEEMRFIRRTVRDELFRAWEAEKTFMQWKSVIAGEKIYIEPYISSAKIRVNTASEMEPSFFVKVLGEMFGRISEKSPYYADSKALLEKIEKFPPLNKDFLPKDSLLREFVG